MKQKGLRLKREIFESLNEREARVKNNNTQIRRNPKNRDSVIPGLD
jgi:hypothetical protein